MAYKRPSPQPVIEGGTGISSATPYTVFTGGTTSTGPLQNVPSIGSSGNVLVSGGASALPTWQPIAGTGWVEIQSQPVNGVSDVFFTTGITSLYDNYVVVLSNVMIAPAFSGSNASFVLLLSLDGGATYSGPLSNCQKLVPTGSPVWSNDTSSFFRIVSSGVFTNNRDINGTLYFMGLGSLFPSLLLNFVTVIGRSTYTREDSGTGIVTTVQAINSGYWYSSVDPNIRFNAIALRSQNSDLIYGTFTLYGISK